MHTIGTMYVLCKYTVGEKTRNRYFVQEYMRHVQYSVVAVHVTTQYTYMGIGIIYKRNHIIDYQHHHHHHHTTIVWESGAPTALMARIGNDMTWLDVSQRRRPVSFFSFSCPSPVYYYHSRHIGKYVTAHDSRPERQKGWEEELVAFWEIYCTKEGLGREWGDVRLLGKGRALLC